MKQQRKHRRETGGKGWKRLPALMAIVLALAVGGVAAMAMGTATADENQPMVRTVAANAKSDTVSRMQGDSYVENTCVTGVTGVTGATACATSATGVAGATDTTGETGCVSRVTDCVTDATTAADHQTGGTTVAKAEAGATAAATTAQRDCNWLQALQNAAGNCTATRTSCKTNPTNCPNGGSTRTTVTNATTTGTRGTTTAGETTTRRTTTVRVTTQATTAVSGNSQAATLEQQVVTLVNEIRRKNGLATLKTDAAVAAVARKKAEDMAKNGYFSHQSPTYGSPFDMMTAAGISYRAAGENIAKGYATAQAVVDGWMNSEGHRANILNSKFTAIGVGYCADGKHWVQEFIG